MELRPSRSRPDIGIMKVKLTTYNQANEPVQFAYADHGGAAPPGELATAVRPSGDHHPARNRPHEIHAESRHRERPGPRDPGFARQPDRRGRRRPGVRHGRHAPPFPPGASTGEHEALELRDGDKKRYLGKGVLQGRARTSTSMLGPVVVGRDAFDQAGLDAAMIDGRRHAEQGQARRQRDPGRVDGGGARRRGRARAAALPVPRRAERARAARAADEHHQRRRARRQRRSTSRSS